MKKLNIKEDEAFEILEGPDKFDLITKSFSGKNQYRTRIKFVIRSYKGPIKIGGPPRRKKTLKVIIKSLSWRDESGVNFWFEGNDIKGRKVEGYYHTKYHSGCVQFEVVPATFNLRLIN